MSMIVVVAPQWVQELQCIIKYAVVCCGILYSIIAIWEYTSSNHSQLEFFLHNGGVQVHCNLY